MRLTAKRDVLLAVAREYSWGVADVDALVDAAAEYGDLAKEMGYRPVTGVDHEK